MKGNSRFRLPPRTLALIPLAVGVNLAMGQFAAVLHLPIFLDTVGTVVVGGLAGPWVAVLTGVVSQVATTVVSGNATWLGFLPVQVAVALYAGYAARYGLFATAWTSIAAGLGLGIIAALMSWPIAYLLFGGVTGSGVTVVTALLTMLGMPLTWSVFVASFASDVVDKMVTFLIVHAVLVTLPRRIAASFPDASRAVGHE